MEKLDQIDEEEWELDLVKALREIVKLLDGILREMKLIRATS
ncbi:unnamed protein product [marine sediment metagenome]|uniref:Uncharacterized protein n=1 Tax=marine sediment metagenome TaxID=412755 RepID=X1JIS1_9ZZZZ